MCEILFTPAALLDLLTQIDELSGLEIGLTETFDDKLQLQIGDSTYELEGENITEVQVDESEIDAIQDANLSAYQDLADTGEIELSQPVTSGIIKELAKSLLLGGMIRLSAKLLRR